MVFALIVHSSTPVLNGVESTTGEKDGTVPPESVDVYFSYFYEKISGKDSDALAQAIATSAARSLWQQNEYNKPFQPRQGSTASRSNPTIASPSKSGSRQSKEIKTDGMFYLPASKFLDASKIALWRLQELTMYTIVCYPDENRLLAGQFLKALPRYLTDQFKSSSSISATPREFFMRPDDFLTVLHLYLPGGQLLFMSDDFEKQLKRESDAAAPKS